MSQCVCSMVTCLGPFQTTATVRVLHGTPTMRPKTHMESITMKPLTTCPQRFSRKWMIWPRMTRSFTGQQCSDSSQMWKPWKTALGWRSYAALKRRCCTKRRLLPENQWHDSEPIAWSKTSAVAFSDCKARAWKQCLHPTSPGQQTGEENGSGETGCRGANWSNLATFDGLTVGTRVTTLQKFQNSGFADAVWCQAKGQSVPHLACQSLLFRTVIYVLLWPCKSWIAKHMPSFHSNDRQIYSTVLPLELLFMMCTARGMKT